MITMDLREAIQLQSVYGPSTGAYALVADLGKARDSVLQFLAAPIFVRVYGELGSEDEDSYELVATRGCACCGSIEHCRCGSIVEGSR